MKEDRAKKLAENALEELKRQLDAGHSKSLRNFLKCVGRFHHYSWLNCLLIGSQNPTATRVAGFRKWKEFKRSVRKGEKGIAILAPMTFRKKVEDEQGDEAVTVGLRGFKVVYVFDVSQTEGEDLPEFSLRISGDPGEILSRLESLIRESGICLRDQSLPNGSLGVSQMGTIIISEMLGAAERFAVLAHEFAHEWLHDPDYRKETTSTVLETEAEAVAFAVCCAFGLECSTRSSDYIQLHRGDSKVLSRSLERIQKTATRMIDALEAAGAEKSAA